MEYMALSVECRALVIECGIFFFVWNPLEEGSCDGKWFVARPLLLEHSTLLVEFRAAIIVIELF